MGLIRIMEKGGDEYYDYKKALKTAKDSLRKAKESIDEICELTEEMEDQYSMRGYRMRGGYSQREEDMDSMSERRRR